MNESMNEVNQNAIFTFCAHKQLGLRGMTGIPWKDSKK